MPCPLAGFGPTASRDIVYVSHGVRPGWLGLLVETACVAMILPMDWAFHLDALAPLELSVHLP